MADLADRDMEKSRDTAVQKRDRQIDILFFCLLLSFVSLITLYLFARQTTGSEALYHSDMKAYILEMQGLDSGYSFPYPVFFKLSAFLHLFTGPEFAVALATMLLNSLGMVVMKLMLNRLALPEVNRAFRQSGHLRNRTWLAGVALSILAVSLFFISMLYLPKGMLLPGMRFKYLGVFTANPFHNATYMAARPFAILAFFWYVRLLDCYEKESGNSRADYILFSLFLLLATMTKPSFTIVLVGTAGLIMVYRLFRSGFRNFIPTLRLGLCFLPTFLDLLYQFQGVFVPDKGTEGGIGFCFGEVWGLYCKNFPAAILLGIGFPVLVLALNFKELGKNTVYRFSWQIYLMSFAMAFLLYEKGFRKPDFNFSWGYMYGIFFSFVGALLVLLRATAAKKKPLLLVVQWLGYLAHVVCGLYYFYGILRGNMYY
ncbi:MAG: hypothetical protein NC081_01425 [Roseburia sp.]|nr:hypothetical protein [Roseburia sp.]